MNIIPVRWTQTSRSNKIMIVNLFKCHNNCVLEPGPWEPIFAFWMPSQSSHELNIALFLPFVTYQAKIQSRLIDLTKLLVNREKSNHLVSDSIKWESDNLLLYRSGNIETAFESWRRRAFHPFRECPPVIGLHYDSPTASDRVEHAHVQSSRHTYRPYYSI